MTTCREMYRMMNEKCTQILESSFEGGGEQLQSQSHTFLGDFYKWTELLADKLELPMLESALREYHFSLLAVSQGQYRFAYMGLRLFLEQALGAVYFSSNEFELRLWLSEKQDLIWSAILDIDKGIFSKRYVEVYFPELLDEASIYREMAKTLYRECSEYTHANYKTYDILPNSLEFRRDIYNDWHDKAETARIVVVFIMCLRYLRSLKTKEEKGYIESSIMEYIGHIAAIRAYYDIFEEAE